MLQPIITAASFLLLGQSVAAQKAVCILFVIALLCTTYFIASKLFDRWTGLAAALLVLPNDRIPDLTAYGLNDIGASVFNIAAMYAIYLAFDENSRYRRFICAAVWTGLAIHQKFQGIFLVFAFVIWQLVRTAKVPGKTIARSAVFFAVLVAIGSPLIVRNYRLYGQFAYPANHLVNHLGCAWDPSYNRWRAQIVYYKPYWEHELPTYGYLLKHRGAKYLFYDRPVHELKRLFNVIFGGVIIERTLLIFMVLGIALAWKKRKRWVLWNGVLFFSSMSFALFRGIEPRYYVFFVPMAAIFGAHLLVELFRRLRLLNRIAAAAFLLLCIPYFIWPVAGRYKASVELTPEQAARYDRFISMCDWIKADTKPDEGVLAWRAAEVSFETGRYAATIPNTGLARWIQIADEYKLRYLVVDGWKYYRQYFQRPGSQYWVLRQLAPLYVGAEVYGFKLVYSDGDDLYIYRVPLPGEVDLENLPMLPPEPDDFTVLLLEPDRGGLTERPPPLMNMPKEGTNPP